MNRFSAILYRVARSFERSEADRTELVSGRPPRWYRALFGLCAAALAMTWAPPFWNSLVRWYRLEPEIALRNADVRVHYGDSPAPCADLAADSKGCIADPSSPLLWRDGARRFDGRHESLIKKRLWHDFWLGITISPETLTAARRAGATQLMLSHIYSSYRVWINGVFVKAARGANDPVPILLPLSAADLRSRTPLRAAIHVYFDEEHIPPDHFCENLPLGLVRPETADQYVFMMRFWESGRPLALALSFGLLSALFFFLWAPAPVKQEYFFLALFCAAAAGWEARWVDFLQRQIAYSTALGIGLATRMCLSGFALLLGLSFARASHRILRLGLAFTIVLAAAAPWLAPTVQDRAVWRDILMSWATPIAFLLGGASCLLQALALGSRRRNGVPVRARRLVLFGSGMVAVALYYFLDSHGVLPTTFRTFWRGFELLGFMLYFAALALKDYGEDEELVRKAPVSDYHRRPVLPTLVTGALFVADLKSSEPLYRQRALSRSVDLVGMWRSQVYSVVLARGGTIIHRKGDEVAILFDRERSPDPLSIAIAAFAEIERASALLSDELRRQGLLPAGVEGLFFRASVALGSIRPTWEELAGHREAYWEEAGDTSPFVEAARLLEMEREVPGTTAARTILVMREDAASSLPSLAPNFFARDFACRDKHGTEYRVAAFCTTLSAGRHAEPRRRRRAKAA